TAGTATATDNCTGSPAITSSSLSAEVGTGCSRTRSYTYTATDNCGNSATCVQTFTYTVDTDAPVFTSCPASSSLGCNPTSFPTAGTATASDVCTGTPAITTSSLGAEVGTGCSRSRSYTYTATDNCGNSATCR